MIPTPYLEPDHAAPGASRRGGLDLIGGPQQCVEAVTDSERGGKPPRERYVHGEVAVPILSHLVDVDRDPSVTPCARAEQDERGASAESAEAGEAAASRWERRESAEGGGGEERKARRGRDGEHASEVGGGWGRGGRGEREWWWEVSRWVYEGRG